MRSSYKRVLSFESFEQRLPLTVAFLSEPSFEIDNAHFVHELAFRQDSSAVFLRPDGRAGWLANGDVTVPARYSVETVDEAIRVIVETETLLELTFTVSDGDLVLTETGFVSGPSGPPQSEVRFSWSPDFMPEPGDINEDSSVNIFDFFILQSSFGKSTDATWADGDLNCDGAVNFADFLILARNHGN